PSAISPTKTGNTWTRLSPISKPSGLSSLRKSPPTGTTRTTTMTGDPTGAPLTGLPVSPQASSAESDQTRRTKITLSAQNGHRGLHRMDHKSDKASWAEQQLNLDATPSATSELTTEPVPENRSRL